MAINNAKVATGGIAAGVVMGLIDLLLMRFVTGPRMVGDLNNFQAGLGDTMNAPNAWIGTFGMDVVLGILLVWLYAAIRPRFGAGMKTAVYAAIYMWLLGCLFSLGFGMMGMMSWGLWMTVGVMWLVTLIIVASIGGRLYTEDGAAS